MGSDITNIRHQINKETKTLHYLYLHFISFHYISVHQWKLLHATLHTMVTFPLPTNVTSWEVGQHGEGSGNLTAVFIFVSNFPLTF